MKREPDGRITVEFEDEVGAGIASADRAYEVDREQRYAGLSETLDESTTPITLTAAESDTLEDAFRLAVSEGDFSSLSPDQRRNIDHWLFQIATKES